MAEKYSFLRFVSKVFKVLAVLTFVIGLLYSLLVFSSFALFLSTLLSSSRAYGGQNWGALLASGLGFLFSLVATAISAFTIFAFGALIELMIDLESNTRRTGQLLERLIDQ